LRCSSLLVGTRNDDHDETISAPIAASVTPFIRDDAQ
jgi:hypothetical protein